MIPRLPALHTFKETDFMKNTFIYFRQLFGRDTLVIITTCYVCTKFLTSTLIYLFFSNSWNYISKVLNSRQTQVNVIFRTYEICSTNQRKNGKNAHRKIYG